MHLYSTIPTLLLASFAAASPVARPAQQTLYRRQEWDAAPYQVQTPPLDTKWTYTVGTNPWTEYPRPQLERSQWQNLNGIWKYQAAESNDPDTLPRDMGSAKEVLIPSCLESGLSGIQGKDMFYSWFQTSFDTPVWDPSTDRVLINFGAVDYEATVYVNGQKVGSHTGGYFTFTFDITDALDTAAGSNELLVFVFDPTDLEGYNVPTGKQVLQQEHIWYRPCSGIWQQVWIEAAPANHISRLDVAAGSNGQVNVTVVSSASSSDPVSIEIRDRKSGSVVGTAEGSANTPFVLNVQSPKLWSPSSPYLYDITAKLGADEVSSYTGFRTISKGEVNGIPRPLLNGEFVFQFGTLDQGYWPDGLYTPPNYEAMVFDLQLLKDLGFNMVRKHIKVENPLFYKACDEMGLLVIQDMPSLPVVQNKPKPNAAEQAEFERQLDLLINQQKNYPSITTWVIYNEGWGQIETAPYPEIALTDRVRELDPTRLIDSTSGWFDHGAGDWHDNHHYTEPQCGTPFNDGPSTPYDPSRIGFQGEFAGVGHNVTIDHLWNVQQAIDQINQTYVIDVDLPAWNARSHDLLEELRNQTATYACSGGVWTQTTDVEGEVNGLVTYDREIQRTDVEQWKADIQAIYDAAASRVKLA